MSWDLIVFAAETPLCCDAEGVASFADHWEPPFMGEAEAVSQRISKVFPDTDWSDPTWGVVLGETFALEFSLGALHKTNTFGIHARGEATGAALRLAEATGWRLLDVSTTRWLNLSDDPDASRRAYQTYLDRVNRLYDAPRKPGLLARLFRR